MPTWPKGPIPQTSERTLFCLSREDSLIQQMTLSGEESRRSRMRKRRTRRRKREEKEEGGEDNCSETFKTVELD